MNARDEVHELADRLAILIADTRKLTKIKREDGTHLAPAIERTRLEARAQVWDTDLKLLLRMRDRAEHW